MIFKSTLICIALSGCLSHQINNSEFPIVWNTGFTMVDLLESNDDLGLTSNADLAQLINATWYAEFELINTASGESSFSSCQDLFNQSLPTTYTRRDSEYSAYLSFKTMCSATKLLVHARSSKVSYIPPTIFTKNTPNIWPKSFAIRTSALEAQRINNNSTLNSWNDVTPISGYEFISDTKAIYSNTDVKQELEIVGKGDFNDDEVEDLLLLSQDALTDSNYFNSRLFMMTVDAVGNWKELTIN